MIFDSFCKIFIDTDCQYDDLFDRIYSFLNCEKRSFSDIYCRWCTACVKFNDYFSLNKHLQNPDDFIYWRYYIETENIDGSDTDEYIMNVKRLIEYLRSFCKGVVPSCDFEELLK